MRITAVVVLPLIVATAALGASRDDVADQIDRLHTKVGELVEINRGTRDLIGSDAQAQAEQLREEIERARDKSAQVEKVLASAERAAANIVMGLDRDVVARKPTLETTRPAPRDELGTPITETDGMQRSRWEDALRDGSGFSEDVPDLRIRHEVADEPRLESPRPTPTPGRLVSSEPRNQRVVRAEPDAAQAKEEARRKKAQLAGVSATPNQQEAPQQAASPERREAGLIYRAGTGAYLRSEFDEAIARFTELIDTYPDHPKSLESLYWRAECYRRRDQCERAVDDWTLFLDKTTTHPLVPGALDRCARCLETLGRDEAAAALRDRLLRDYPASTEARRLRRAPRDSGIPLGTNAR